MLFAIAISLLLLQATWGQFSSSFRPEPTVATWATIGVAQTPTVSNPAATVAQNVCPGYSLSGVQKTDRGLMANLTLNGSPCNAYGKDYTNLILSVYYDTETRLHVTIEDVDNQQYRIPGSLVTNPEPSATIGEVDYSFNYNESPFEFWILRNDGDILFDTRGYKLIFETQYIELTTNMEEDYNIYGLGEAIHSLRLHKNFTRTMWAKYLSLYTILIAVMKPIQLMGTYMVHILSTSNINIQMDLTGAVMRLMVFISETQMEWIYCCKTPHCNIVPSVEFLTCTSTLDRRRKMSSDSMSHLLVYPPCTNIGHLASISVVGDTAISQSCKMLSTITRISISLSKLFGRT